MDTQIKGRELSIIIHDYNAMTMANSSRLGTISFHHLNANFGQEVGDILQGARRPSRLIGSAILPPPPTLILFVPSLRAPITAWLSIISAARFSNAHQVNLTTLKDGFPRAQANNPASKN